MSNTPVGALPASGTLSNKVFQEVLTKYRLTQREKEADDFLWYKQYADMLDKYSFYDDKFFGGFGGEVTSFKQKKVNYDLFNNIIDKNDLKYVYRPYGEEVGELPANMTNRDIVSPKIKVLLGMEMSMPFSWGVVATDEMATSRKEQQETDMLKQYVISQIMTPIQQQAELQAQQSTQGRQLTPDEQQQIQQQVAEQTKAMTPDEVKQYMTREHQDPAEILASQILQYLTYEERIPDKFNKMFKHMMLGGKEVARVGITNGNPSLQAINALFFDHDMSPELDFIEDGAWAVAEYRMSPDQILSTLGSKLKPDEIDKIYSYYRNRTTVLDTDFTFSDTGYTTDLTIRCLHCTWKAPMKVQFLTYIGEDGTPQEKIVDENYKMDEDAGDIDIEVLWVPQTHETWKILDNIYVYCQPVPGQYKDLDNLWIAKLPYYGAAIDNLNSPITSPMERMKAFQYYYDIILYRLELVLASDKGKKLMMNIKALPKSSGIDIHKWIYFFDANSIGFLNPMEEGNKGSGNTDMASLAKEIDLSTASQIQNYINLAEYIEGKCGASIGVTKPMEGAIAPNDAVTNTKQNLIQSNYIVRPYFELHNQVKRNILQALIETAKVAYSGSKPKKLQYMMDDMSIAMITVDPELLDNSTYGVYVSNSSKNEEMKQAIVSLAQAALQNQQATILDIANVMGAASVQEAKELLQKAQQDAQDRESDMEQQKQQMLEQQQQRQDKLTRDLWEHEKEMLLLKESEERKTKLQVEAMAAMAFDPNKDENANQEPDVFEVYKYGTEADFKQQNADTNAEKLQLEKSKFAHQQVMDTKKLQLENKKLEQAPSGTPNK